MIAFTSAHNDSLYDYDLLWPGRPTIQFRWTWFGDFVQQEAHKSIVCVWHVKRRS